MDVEEEEVLLDLLDLEPDFELDPPLPFEDEEEREEEEPEGEDGEDPDGEGSDGEEPDGEELDGEEPEGDEGEEGPVGLECELELRFNTRCFPFGPIPFTACL